MQLQALYCGNVRGQKIQYINVEPESEQPGKRDQECQPKPETRPQFHGRRNPSMNSPVRALTSFHAPFVCVKVQSPGGEFPWSAAARCNQPKRALGVPVPENDRCRGGKEIRQ